MPVLASTMTALSSRWAMMSGRPASVAVLPRSSNLFCLSIVSCVRWPRGSAGPDVSLLGLSWLLAFDDGFADQVGERWRVFVVVPQSVDVAVL